MNATHPPRSANAERSGLTRHIRCRGLLAAVVAAALLSPFALYQVSRRSQQFASWTEWPSSSTTPRPLMTYDQVWEFFASRPVTARQRSQAPLDYDYKFTVAGHIRSEVDPPYPFLRGFVDEVERINAASKVLVLLGDIQTTNDPRNWDLYDAAIRDRLSVPVLLALGNHDTRMKGTLGESLRWYGERYGPAYFATRIRRSLAVVLCTEPGHGDIEGEQLEFLIGTLQAAQSDDSVDHVFLFMHRVAWFYGNERYRNVIRLANNSSIENHRDPDQQLLRRRAFWQVVFPELRTLAETKPVYVFAGDVGRRAPIVYDRLDGVHLLATGCRGYRKEQTWNHVIDVYVKGKDVRLHAVDLDGIPLARPEHYSLDFWASLEVK